jgi:hypothetical protein
MINNKFRKGLKPTNPFPKNSNPWNSGVKDFRPSPQTEFKKGISSGKKLQIGTIRIRNPKRENKPRSYIKITKNKWEALAIFIWKKFNGSIPKGFVVHHIDHNQLNDNINNLQLLSKPEHQRIHMLKDPIEYYI